MGQLFIFTATSARSRAIVNYKRLTGWYARGHVYLFTCTLVRTYMCVYVLMYFNNIAPGCCYCVVISGLQLFAHLLLPVLQLTI